MLMKIPIWRKNHKMNFLSFYAHKNDHFVIE